MSTDSAHEELRGLLERSVDRRTFLGAAGGALLVGAVGYPFLEACTTTTTGTPVPAAATKLPAYIPIAGVKADLPPIGQGTAPGYFTYPAQPIRSVTRTPSAGGTVTAQLLTYKPPPTPMENNAAWQEVNRRLGATFKPTITPYADYSTKYGTLVAGGDLPDFILLALFLGLPNVYDFLRSQCADLTPYLSGDAIKDYPNLANFPTECWRFSSFNGAIYGLPQPRTSDGQVFLVHQEMLDQAGIGQLKDSDDFLRAMTALNRPQEGRWALLAWGGLYLNVCNWMFRVPNNFKVDSAGRFTKDIETEEFKAALAYNLKLVQAGLFMPGSVNMPYTQAVTNFIAGKAASIIDRFGPIPGGNPSASFWTPMTKVNPAFRLGAMIPPGFDGGKPVQYLSRPSFGVTALKKAGKDRIRELLRVADFFAAPFGSQEHVLLNYGIENLDYNRSSIGNPVLTSQGASEMTVPWLYLTAGPPVNFDTVREYVQFVHQTEERFSPIAVRDPSVGLFSATSYAKGGALGSMYASRINDILAGRSPMTDYDQIVKDWRSQGGDQIKTELQQAWTAAQK